MKLFASALFLVLAIPFVAAGGCGKACCSDGSCKTGFTCVGGGCLPFPPPPSTGTQGPTPTGQPAGDSPNTPLTVALPVIGTPGTPLASGFISGTGIVQVGEKGSAANVGYGETFTTKLNGGAARVYGRESLSGRSEGGGSGQTSVNGATEVIPGDGGLSQSTGSSQNGFFFNHGKGVALAENRVTLDSRPDQATAETTLRTLSVGLKGAGVSNQFSVQTLDP
ncbi:hypothetical protein BSKO_10042 [Bryopsis sp. KO-2023]|nr:hypothetical protein BSKO_10042 [Bryopsis sp. KO-2023]